MMPSTSSIMQTSALTARRPETGAAWQLQTESGSRAGAAAAAVFAGGSALASGGGA